MNPVEPTGEVARVIEQQRQWARRVGIPLDDGGGALRRQRDATFIRVPRRIVRALDDGAGGEYDRLPSLRSSTCLSLNVHLPWLRSPAGVVRGYGTAMGGRSMTFEAKQPTGLGGTAPHLDVLITGDGPALAIEAKFLEMYSSAGDREPFRPSYFRDPDLWSGIPRCRELATAISRREVSFAYLGAPQLLKHALGLSANQASGFRLVLLWYRVAGEVADQIDAEIAEFTAAVDIDFQAVTYQELVARLREGREPRRGYFDYVADRYGL